MRVDAAGRDIGALGIDDLCLRARWRETGCDAEDLAIFDPDALASWEDFGGRDLLTAL